MIPNIVAIWMMVGLLVLFTLALSLRVCTVEQKVDMQPSADCIKLVEFFRD